MSGAVRLDLTSLETYSQSCLALARERLSGFGSMAEIAAAEADLNAYPNLGRLSEPEGVYLLDEEALAPADLDRARETVLQGGVFWEHTAAGEATRLKLGTKYVILPPRDLSLERVAGLISAEQGQRVTPEALRQDLELEPEGLLPLTLGGRHMLQHAFDLTRLAEEAGQDPAEVLARQKVLLILNEKTAETILAQVRQGSFGGFAPSNFLFMVQPAFPGINLAEGEFFFDPESPRRLHNHGQLVMQETMDDQIFRLDDSGRRVYLSSEEVAGLLGETADKISYNIEDLDYLTGSLDWPSLALALKLGGEGYHMVMEIVANNPERPQKGGLAAFDQVLGRNVMIESFQLKGVSNEEIKFLNKNFNHYTNPRVSWAAVQDQGLPMPLAVKKGYLYFQAVQGDINFLVKTAFVQRKVLKPIRAWKSAANTPAALKAMGAQDRQPGFREFVYKTLGAYF